jgi:hypothetical protein
MPSELPPEGTPSPRQPPNRELSAAAKDRMGALGALTPGRVSAKDAQALSALVAAGRITYDDVAKVMPTTRPTSGATTARPPRRNGPAKMLVSQPSFTPVRLARRTSDRH